MGAMYKKHLKTQCEFAPFDLGFNGRLRKDNRWVVKASLVPWDTFEPEYAKLFPSEEGRPAFPFRVVLGTLIIKEELGISDDETVLQIQGNPYLQYFIGFTSYQTEVPFDGSTLVLFRKRLKWKGLSAINDLLVNKAETVLKEHKPKGGSSRRSTDTSNQPENKEDNEGILKLDSTCTPADIRYPLDLSLLDEARRDTEKIIDILYEKSESIAKKPRTYRIQARKAFLSVIRKRRKSAKEIRKAIGKQLRYLKRNLMHIKEMVQAGSSGVVTVDSPLNALSKEQYRNLLVIHELYRQQKEMYDNRNHKVDDRIVSIRQPHVRPIVRGKARTNVEFGAKVSMSVINHFDHVDRISFDAYNEGGDLAAQVEAYKCRTGKYPESVLADKIYRNRENYRYCTAHGIHLAGPKLGRTYQEGSIKSRVQKKSQLQDEIDRVEVEGRFEVLKRRFTWDLIKARLVGTSEVWIMIAIIAANLDQAYRAILPILLLYFALFYTEIGNRFLRQFWRWIVMNSHCFGRLARNYS
jgi:hypothetical protein